MTLFALPPHVDPRPVQRWLLAVAGMIFVMIVIGGVTRLTESGLSITDWRPATGWLPPTTDAEWRAIFERYRDTPQFEQVFPTLTLAGFKEIYWLEYVHRLWGRLIGVAFLVPFLVLWAAGRISRRMMPHLVALFVLGGLQGALGWFMVQSGLVDRPTVSQYRLAAHLALALFLYGYILLYAWALTMPRAPAAAPANLRRAGTGLLVLTGLTILAGAFVAGLDAGKIYNSFPRMGPYWIPPEYWRAELAWANPFENPVTAQLNHRVLGVLTLIAAAAFWVYALREPLSDVVHQMAASALLVAVILQLGIGIATLLSFVPVWLGALHQAGAVVVLTAVLWLFHQTRRVHA